MASRRVIVIVLDSCGVGALPDAARYGDEKTNTLGHIAEHMGGLKLPNLGKMGLGNIIPIQGVEAVGAGATGSWGKSLEMSAGKDTNTGHYELMGFIMTEPFPTYPKGFPREILDEFCKVCGFKGFLGNKPASGTAIIDELGPEHVRTGLPIVYTSADSVFQVAAHEDIIPPKKLWDVCAEALNIFRPPNDICRVIARPFVGTGGNFRRTANRRDFTRGPAEKTVLDYLKEDGISVYGIGKIEDIYNKQGVTKAVHTEDNKEGILKTIEAIRSEEGLIFTNLVDFDMKYGHRNNPEGYAVALSEFDNYLPEILREMRDNDMLIITADHGCDPTYLASTDHSREYIPILVYGKRLKNGIDLGVRKTFADIGATVADYLGVKTPLKYGKSFANDLT